MARPNTTMNFNAFLEKDKLKDDGSNFSDWFMNLKIILTAAKKLYVLDAPLGDAPAANAAEDVRNVYAARSEDHEIVKCGLLYGLGPKLQKRFEHHGVHQMINDLKAMFQTQAKVERYEASSKFFSCMMEENSSVSEHVLKMSGYGDRLAQLGVVIPNELGIDRVLQSLPPSYKSFVMNYNMQGMEKTLPELFAMLKTAEVEIKKEHQVLMVNKTTSFKKKGISVKYVIACNEYKSRP